MKNKPIKTNMILNYLFLLYLLFSSSVKSQSNINNNQIKYNIKATYEVLENNNSVDLDFIEKGNFLIDFFRGENFDNIVVFKNDDKTVKIKVFSATRLNTENIAYDKELYNKISKSENKPNKEISYNIIMSSDFQIVNEAQIVE